VRQQLQSSEALAVFDVNRENAPKGMSYNPKDIVKTGRIWKRSSRDRAHTVATVCDTLANSYPTTRLGNPRDPLADLIYITVSNRTTPDQAAAAYKELRSCVRKWDDLLTLSRRSIERTLRPAGLSSIKAAFLLGIARSLHARFGRVTLRPLSRMTDAQRLEFLTSLPGVSDKVARCVMMYCFNSPVLPVDVHVHRLARRLGWTSRKRADQSHDELEALVPHDKRMRFHIDAILHGRAVCASSNPRCGECVLRPHCHFGRWR
jgi:endonuclease-3